MACDLIIAYREMQKERNGLKELLNKKEPELEELEG